ncbi:MAG: hypothetical protein R3F35_12645 [Myxococcota bacterium]
MGVVVLARGLMLAASVALVAGCSSEREDANAGPAVDPVAARIEVAPPDGATQVAVGVWPELRVEPAEAAAAIGGIDFVCGDEAIATRVHRLPAGRIVVQPERRLPAETACRLAWSRPDRRESTGFKTFRASEAPGRSLYVLYRRANPGEVAPIPDDYWTVADPASATGLRLDLPVALRSDLSEVVEGLRAELARADGWSPIGPIVLSMSERIDTRTLPRTVEASLDPTSTVALVDVDPTSPERGRRFPFEAILRKDRTAIGLEDHVLWVLPARPLRPGGRYALLVRRGVATRAGRAMVEPAQLRRILAGRGGSTSGAQADLAVQLEPAIAVAGSALAIPWTRDDLVFALSFTVRSLAELERDPLALLDAVRALPGPRIAIERVEVVRDPERPLAALVHGHFATPVWRERRRKAVSRDAAGLPRVVGRDALRFVLALPRQTLQQRATLLVYQHGNPGSAREEIGGRRQDPYLEAGFAIIGFTDLWNRGKTPAGLDRREIIVSQVGALADAVRRERVVPDDWLVTLGEQLALLEALPELGTLDVLPPSRPDGIAEIDATGPFVYEGVSQGAIHGQALVAYSDRIRAASLVAGGARLAELALHQAAGSMVKALPYLFGDFRPIDLWVTLALFQTAIDRQDPHLHAMRLSRGGAPIGAGPGVASRFAGSRSTIPHPSLLLTAGQGDGYVPNRASRSLAWVLGPLAWIDPPADASLWLPTAEAPLRGNLGDGTTGAYLEVVPYGSADPGAPGCRPEALPLPEDLLREGHFCAQLAEESVRRRVRFLRSAVDDAPPVVIDPFAAEGLKVARGRMEQERGS